MASASTFLQAKADDWSKQIEIDAWAFYQNAANDFPAQPNVYDYGIYALLVADMLALRLHVIFLSFPVTA